MGYYSVRQSQKGKEMVSIHRNHPQKDSLQSHRGHQMEMDWELELIQNFPQTDWESELILPQLLLRMN